MSNYPKSNYTPFSRSEPKAPPKGPAPTKNRYPQQCAIDVDELMKLEMLSETVDNPAVYSTALYQNAQLNTSANTVVTKTATGVRYNKNENAVIQSYVNFYSSLRNGSVFLQNGEMSFDIPPFNNNLTMQDVIQIEVFPFLMRNISNPTVGGVNFFYYNRVYMAITSLSYMLGFNGSTLQSYMFEFQADYQNAVCINLTPKNPLLTFPAPIQINTFSVRFYVPDVYGLKPIPLPQDIVTVLPVFVAGFGTNPAQFTVIAGGTTADITPYTGVLSTVNPDNRIAVSFNGFNTISATINSTVMNGFGWLVTDIINSTTFAIAGLDLTGLQDPTTLTPPSTYAAYYSNMSIMPNKIDMGVRFTILKNVKTNSLTPVVI